MRTQLDYQSVTNRRNWSVISLVLVVQINVALCVFAAGIATWAWCVDFHWRITDATGRNSFPMGAFAREATAVAAALLIYTAIVRFAVWRLLKRLTPERVGETEKE